MKRPDLKSKAQLEPTFSPAQVGEYLGLGPTKVAELIKLGKVHGTKLHPRLGGLAPTFRVSHKCRRIPQSAIERHLRHMARVSELPTEPMVLVVAGGAG